MAHRDALDAALARVQALESQIAELAAARPAADELARMRDERDDYARKAEALQRLLDRVARTRASGQTEPPTLYEYNRQFAPMVFTEDPARERRWSGVRCPMCFAVGESAEMFRGMGGIHIGSQLVPAICPRCGFIGHVRDGSP